MAYWWYTMAHGLLPAKSGLFIAQLSHHQLLLSPPPPPIIDQHQHCHQQQQQAPIVCNPGKWPPYLLPFHFLNTKPDRTWLPCHWRWWAPATLITTTQMPTPTTATINDDKPHPMSIPSLPPTHSKTTPPAVWSPPSAWPQLPCHWAQWTPTTSHTHQQAPPAWWTPWMWPALDASRAHHECRWSAGIHRLPAKKNLQIMHLQLRIKTFPWVKADPGSSVRVLQVPASTHRLLASSSRLVFWSNKAGYFEILKW